MICKNCKNASEQNKRHKWRWCSILFKWVRPNQKCEV